LPLRCTPSPDLAESLTSLRRLRGVEKGNCRSLHYAPPDFLLNLVGSASFMRLSLRKAAHAVPSTAAQRKIRVRYGRDDKG
jgi:hypothetical protein